MTWNRPWPLYLIAAPAAVAIWSGWVGLGGMCGFGVIHPLPGIWDSVTINTAITLPVGVESYGAYAMHAWLARTGISDRARGFARKSVFAAFGLGCLGQVAFHLMAAAGWSRAPWYVVMLVACLPVVTLGLGVALAHLLQVPVPEPAPAAVPVAVPDVPPAHPAEAEPFADELAQGKVPGIRRIREVHRCGQPKAQEIQGRLAVLAAAR